MAADRGGRARRVGALAPFKPRDADLFAIIGAFDAQYATWAEFQSAMERYWCLRWLKQHNITRTVAHVLRDDLVRFGNAPLVTRVGGMPELERGTAVEIDILGMDELSLELDCRYLGQLAPPPRRNRKPDRARHPAPAGRRPATARSRRAAGTLPPKSPRDADRCHPGGAAFRPRHRTIIRWRNDMRILLVEDNLDRAMPWKASCAGRPQRPMGARRPDGVAARLDETWDALVLDINLPGKDGFSVIRELRAPGLEAPVLVMTARAEIEDKIDMLDLGADDYGQAFRPARTRSPPARIDAPPAGQTSSVTTYGNLGLDLAARGVSVDGAPVELGRREFRLLEILLGKFGQTVAKERLMNQLFDTDDGSLNALELLISRLRKLAGASVDIVTVRGVGYARLHETPAARNDAGAGPSTPG